MLKAELVAEENQLVGKLWRVKNSIGVIYSHVSNFEQSLDYFQESYAITQHNKELYNKGSSPLINIGVLYAKEKKYEEALFYYKKAYDIAEKTDSEIPKKYIANNMASIYNRLGNIKLSFEILEKVKDPVDDAMANFFWKGIYISALFSDGQTLKSQQLAEKLYTELETGRYKDAREEGYVNTTSLLSDIYAKQDKIDSAILFVKKALNATDDLTKRIELYDDISNLYIRKKEYSVAYQYKDSTLKATNTLDSIINTSQYEMNKVKFKTQEYQNELKAEKERKRVQQKIFMGAILLALVIFFSIYIGLKNKVIKQRQKATISSLELEKEKKGHKLAEKQKLLTEKELETVKLKQKQLKHEVAEKNRELTAKALYFTKRNKLTQDIIHTIEKSNDRINDKEIAKQIRSIKNLLKADDQQEDFMNHFESVNPLFLTKLKKEHPKLNANDIRFLCYVFMNLNLKEISSVFNITYNAAEIRKRRIKEKIGLNKEASLYSYIISIVD